MVDRRRTSGCCLSLGLEVISWMSRKQTCVALSIVKAEYIANNIASQEIIYLQKLISGLFSQKLDPTIIFRDNQTCMKLSKIRFFMIG